MAKTVIIEEHGGSEKLILSNRDIGPVGQGQVRVRHKFAGLNFIDIYQRSGLYQLPLPTALGMEGSGIVEEVGEGVTHLKEGDRVAYASQPPGSYSEERVMPAAQVCVLPDGVSFEEGAAMMLKGLTVQYLFHRTTPLQKGDTVLFQAAAGGVGLLACQWARSEGITLIGTAGTDEKCALAVEHGAAHCINYNSKDFLKEVKDITNNEGVDVVMDAVGAATFEGSIDALKPLGMFISFGNASGSVAPINIGMLGQKGSLKITRPTLFTHIAKHDTCQSMAGHLFDKVTSGQVKLRIDQTFALSGIKLAHDQLEARQTTGCSVISTGD